MDGNARAYAPDAPASAADAAAAGPEVVFYQLTKKFVDTEESVPDDAQDVLYYTLAVGHHTGVIDCFEERLRCPLSTYERLVEAFPEGDARYKLAGVMRHGEIQIDKMHLAVMVPGLAAMREAAGAQAAGEAADQGTGEVAALDDEARAVLDALTEMVDVLAREGAAYIMGRIRRP